MTAEAITQDATAARAELVKALVDTGAITDPQWRTAFEKVPRHLFVPAYFDHSGARFAGDDPSTAAQWFTAVHSDKSLVTHRTKGAVTSSSTQPSLMAAMLHALDVADGMHVLEIGTGTGYNAALLSHRLGDEHVTTVDVTLDITGPARKRLTAAGYAPTVVTGDGIEGWPPNAPYDRIIATCRLDAIPHTLFQQLTDSGIILAPLGNALARITRTGPATAEGRFLSGAFFMAMRHGGGTGVTRRPDLPAGSARPSLLPMADIVDGDFRFLVSIVAPGLVWQYDLNTDGVPNGARVWGADGSIADVAPDGTVRESGNLWTRLEDAHRPWVAAGRPTPDRYGVTVDAESQRVWLDSPDGPSWRLAAA